ncbi:MAG: hypothetical protein ACHQIL_00420 [Steroidobacterales bacterium]
MTSATAEHWANVRSAVYLLAQSVGPCCRCKRPTALFSLGLSPGHERQLDDDWVPVNAFALLFFVEYLPPEVIRVLQELAPDYRPARSCATGSKYWLNHCQHCGMVHEDYWLHCEPGAEFLPTAERAAGQIQIHVVRESFAARAGGFSDEIPLLASMRIIG